jgi:uncharacterized protein YndB with AHSA1/START domain
MSQPKKLRFGTIRQSVFLRATPQEVYDSLIDPKRHAEFTNQAATGDGKEGSAFTAGDGYISGKNIELRPGRLIVQQWRTTEWPEGYPDSLLKFTFTKRKGGTTLRMVHSKVPQSQKSYYSKGWKEYYWMPLRKYFENKSKA